MGVDPVAKKMAEANLDRGNDTPKRGESYRCEECGMEIQVTADCHCKAGEHVRFQCCGKDLTRA